MFAYNYIAEQYPNDVNWDIDKILIVTIDIEVQCENGFPNPKDAIEPLLSITVKNHQSKKFVVWGIGKFTNNRDDVTYVECEDEIHLIKEFLTFWERHQPDVITGWNTEFLIYLIYVIVLRFYVEMMNSKDYRLGEMYLIKRFILWVSDINFTIYKVLHI